MNRKIDELGRIVIPAEIRKILNIENNDLLEIKIIGMNIVLKKIDGYTIDSNINEKNLIKELNENMNFLIDYFEEKQI